MQKLEYGLESAMLIIDGHVSSIYLDSQFELSWLALALAANPDVPFGMSIRIDLWKNIHAISNRIKLINVSECIGDILEPAPLCHPSLQDHVIAYSVKESSSGIMSDTFYFNKNIDLSSTFIIVRGFPIMARQYGG